MSVSPLNRFSLNPARMFIVVLCGLMNTSVSAQQEDRPRPSEPASQASNGSVPATADPVPAATAPATQDRPEPTPPPAANGRRNGNGGAPPTTERAAPEGMVQLGFNGVKVEELIPFIVKTTGKVVIPLSLTQLQTKTITLINDKPIPRADALDLLINTLRLNGVGVIEKNDVIILDTIENISGLGEAPVLTAEDDVMTRQDKGLIVIKIFRLTEAPAATVVDRLGENQVNNVVISADENSNQIVFYGTIALAQQYQQLINQLDRNWIKIKTETFRLAYADATEVADQVWELFEDSGAQSAQPGQQRQPRQPRAAQRTGQQGQPNITPAGVTVGQTIPLRVSVNTQQNSVTVSAEPGKVEKIGDLISTEWDLPRSAGTSRVYKLSHTDPLKVEDLLLNLMGQGSSRSGAGGRGGGGGGGGAVVGRGGAGGGATGDGGLQSLGAIYRIRAFPDSNALIVLSKTTEALDFLDAVIEQIDQPSLIGVPLIIELKHANAISLSEELNILLAEAGSGTGLNRPATGLTGMGLGGLDDSGGTGNSGGTGSTSGAGGGINGGGGNAGRIEFPWQRARGQGAGGEPQSPESPLIGKIRIVPIVRQNALAVIAPVEYREAIVGVIKTFDRPGRQVMISAIICAVKLQDDFAMGIRFSSQSLTPTNPDNSISGTLGFSGVTDNLFGNLFDTSMLDTSVDINVLVQALSQKTNIKILQEPRVFTADNQEAYFFDGQDIPFITQSINNGTTGLQNSFEYKAVGVILNVRPRITAQRDIDLEINLEISNVVPGVTLFGGAVLDRRQTTTQVIVKNGQTIVLSGILKDSESTVTHGFPLLSEIPLLGELFKSRENNKSTEELVAFITPVVVDNPSENDLNFNEAARKRLQELKQPIKDQKKLRNQVQDRILNPVGESGPIINPSTPDDPAPATPALPDGGHRGPSDATVVPPSPAPRPPPVDVDNVNPQGPKSP